jgi:hypothetical protein
MAGDVGWMECGALGDANGKEEGKGGGQFSDGSRMKM